MNLGATRIGLAASAALAIVAAAAVMPASAQSKIYPEGTDCTKLVGNSKTECEHQAKNTSAPDNANNPDNAAINTSKPDPVTGASNAPSNAIPPAGEDCTKLVGNSKTECANRAIQNGSRDDSNNPDQQN
jgi:hypothetical protein